MGWREMRERCDEATVGGKLNHADVFKAVTGRETEPTCSVLDCYKIILDEVSAALFAAYQEGKRSVVPEGVEWPRFEDGECIISPQAEPLERPAPKLDADGVEIRVGDTVYDADGTGWTVLRFWGENGLDVERWGDGCKVGTSLFAEDVSHERRDSWERLMEDAALDECEYFNREPDAGCTRTKGCSECRRDFVAELVGRARKLAGEASE